MDSFAWLGCVGLLLIGAPIWAIVAAAQARKRAEETRESVKGLSQRLDLFEKRLLELKREIGGGPPPAEALAADMPAPSPTPRSAEPIPPPFPTLPLSPLSPAPSPPAEQIFPPPPPPLEPPPASRPIDWENLISVKAFAWLGGAALFLGVALFLRYSIQNNWISETARVAIGLVVGAAALAGGDRLRSKADWAGQAACGAGVAILYASLFSAHTLYKLLGTLETFLAMGLVTLVAGVLAVRRSAFVLAVLGLSGGFLTPFLLATKEDRPIALFFYVLLLDLGILTVARRRDWLSLRLLALAGSAILFTGWALRHLDASELPYALVAALFLAALFALLPTQPETDRERRDVARAIPILAIVCVLVLALLASGQPTLAVSPHFLVIYLLVLSAGTVFVSRRSDFVAFVPVAAGFCVLAQTFRAGPDLFPGRRSEVLLLFLVLPAFFVVLWVLRRLSDSTHALRIAAAITLFGALPVLFRVLEVERKEEPVFALWIFALAHAAGLLAIAGLRFSGAWILSAQALLFACLLALTLRFSQPRLAEFLPLVLVPTFLFWILPFVSPRFRNDRLSWLSSAAAPVLHFPLLYVLAKPSWEEGPLGALAVLFGLLALVSLRRAASLLSGPADQQFAMALFGAVTLLFVTAAIPILLDQEWITVAWALEAAGLAWLFTRIPHAGLIKASAILAAAAFARLLVNPAVWSYHPRSGTPVINWYLYTFGIPAVVFLLAARWVKDKEVARSFKYAELLRTAAGVLLFVLLNIEIADFYSTGPTLTFRLSGGGLGEDMTYSLAWGVFALVVLGLGIARKSKTVRAAALVVLALTIGKVFLHDLWSLGALYRVGSIVGLAVALLAVSFLTQRFVFSKERP